MEIQEPKSIEGLFYFTNRSLPNNGWVKIWVFKEHCLKCKKGVMQKPRRRNKRGNKPVKTAKYYVCNNCGYEESASSYESRLVANIKYKCPNCGYESFMKKQFIRKKVKGFLTFIFNCEKCNAEISIPKLKK